MKHIEDFRQAMEACGLVAPERLKDDGKRHRFSSSGKKGDDAGWYVLHGDERPAGAFGCWRLGISERWQLEDRQEFSSAERLAWAKRMAELEARRRHELIEARERASEKARHLWSLGHDALSRTHPYLRKKRIPGIGARVLRDLLLIPVRDRPDNLVGLQVIQPSGERRFLKGTPMAGGYMVLGRLKARKPAVLCEGYATGVSVHLAMRWPVIVAFSAGNLAQVAHKIRQLRTDVYICTAADDDLVYTRDSKSSKESNIGLESARSCGFPTIQPIWMGERGSGTDFNDLHQAEGIEAVKKCFKEQAPACFFPD